MDGAFLYKLSQWGIWSRGGFPGYRSSLGRSGSGPLPDISDDEGQRIDGALCRARRKADTRCFELYYKRGLSAAAIADRTGRSRAKVGREIERVERLLHALLSEPGETRRSSPPRG